MTVRREPAGRRCGAGALIDLKRLRRRARRGRGRLSLGIDVRLVLDLVGAVHIEVLGQAMLFWRQLTHWIGGMGIIILAIAVLPRLRVGGRQLLQGELPGPSCSH